MLQVFNQNVNYALKSKRVFFSFFHSCIHFLNTTSSLAKFKPNAFAIILRGWVYDHLE